MGLPDIVVYIRNGENEELRYAIRTWCENVSFRNLVVVGGSRPPKWLKPDKYIKNPSEYGKVRQAYNNIELAVKSDGITENIILMMDDVFVLQKLGQWPDNFNFNRGTLQAQWESGTINADEDPYTAMIRRTREKMKHGNDEPLSFEEHAPFWCNRKKMLKIFDSYADEIYGMLPRSLYGNTYKCNTEYKPDFKARFCEDFIPKGEFFASSNDITFKAGRIGDYIRAYYRKPSKYEF